MAANNEGIASYVAAQDEILKEYGELFKQDAFCEAVLSDYDQAYRFYLASKAEETEEILVNAAAIRRVITAPLRQRIFFYIALRTHRRRLTAMERVPERREHSWRQGFKAEAAELAGKIEDLRKLNGRHGSIVTDYRGERTPSHVALFRGKYSASCSVAAKIYSDAFDSRSLDRRVHCKDAVRLLRQHSGRCDLIVTDPPYGLNAEIDPEALAELYQHMIDTMITALRDGGQLVLALPDWSHIGKQVPYFTTKQFITQQVLAAAEKHGREVVRTAHALPVPAAAFKPPYYWESERALRRAIIHFRFKHIRHKLSE